MLRHAVGSSRTADTTHSQRLSRREFHCTIEYHLLKHRISDSNNHRICWPIDIDHPVNAALICDALKIGFELFEIRSWHGLKPVHRLGNRSPEGTLEAFRREFEDVLSKATGEDGESKRANLKALREKIARSWEDDGEAWSEIKRIVDVLH